MIKKPWQIWLVFLLCLAIVFPAMAWLSVKTIQLDALRETDRVETENARREAELQERISSALYRMDLKMLPLVAQEASRPYYVYRPFYQVVNPNFGNAIGPAQGGRGGGSENFEGSFGGGLGGSDETSVNFASLPSPLLFQPPKFVLLHFQLGPDEKISSPQRPVGFDNDLARQNFGITQSVIDQNEQRLREATNVFEYAKLLRECPTINLPQFVTNGSISETKKQQRVYNVPALEKLQKQIQEQAAAVKDLVSSKEPAQYANKAQVQRSRGASRVNQEFTRRNDSTLDFAGQQWAANNIYDYQLLNANFDSQKKVAVSPNILEGVMQPMWIDEKLILARRVDGMDQPIVQVCWLDWDAIQAVLKAEVVDLLPKIEFQPIRKDSDLKLGTALTTIPVQLVVDRSSLLSKLAIDSVVESEPSGLRLSLWVAWMGMALAALASGSLLFGVIRLSERRATFVSAVTHELRTPLTTFRMYAEMLAEKMVPEGKQQEYANTLRVQADRLAHLVENVLQFARLERGADSGHREDLTVADLFARFSSRLVERSNQAEMELSITLDESVQDINLKTQPSTIEQIVFNLVDNACKYAKPSNDQRIEVVCERLGNKLRFCVRDHGPGVDPGHKKRMFQPFCKSDQDAANTAAGVGLGLALCKRMAASVGGRLFHEDNDAADSETTPGATFVFELPLG